MVGGTSPFFPAIFFFPKKADSVPSLNSLSAMDGRDRPLKN
jgi:hypothetical protein